MITKSNLEAFLDRYLEVYTLDELLEQFDISVYEVFELLFENGFIDEDLLNE